MPVSVVGDSEFGAVEVMRPLKKCHWDYVLRQKLGHQIRVPGQDWQNFGAVVSKPCQSVWLGQGRLTEKHAYATNLLSHWAQGENEPWLLATDLPDRATTRGLSIHQIGRHLVDRRLTNGALIGFDCPIGSNAKLSGSKTSEQ